MQGPAQVTVDGTAPAAAVAAGDSICAPAGTVHVYAVDAHDQQQRAAAFLRVMLPLSFVLRGRSAEDVRRECSCAAQQVRSSN